ncbi:MAG: site-specific integrase [Actinomycetota bacterium]|nr:site-specific integrase [Actinomycetota bacterium]
MSASRGWRATARLEPHQQTEEGLRPEEAWGDLVFTNEIGGPIESGNLRTRSFQPLLARAGLPPIRFHDLRHSAATLLLGEGVNPKIVSEMLGHAQIAITLDLYSHVTPTMQETAAAALDRVLG